MRWTIEIAPLDDGAKEGGKSVMQKKNRLPEIGDRGASNEKRHVNASSVLRRATPDDREYPTHARHPVNRNER